MTDPVDGVTAARYSWETIEPDHPVEKATRRLVNGERAMVARFMLEEGLDLEPTVHHTEQITIILEGGCWSASEPSARTRSARRCLAPARSSCSRPSRHMASWLSSAWWPSTCSAHRATRPASIRARSAARRQRGSDRRAASSVRSHPSPPRTVVTLVAISTAVERLEAADPEQGWAYPASV